METTDSQLYLDFHDAEEGQKDKLRWYKAIWKPPYFTMQLILKIPRSLLRGQDDGGF
jgi:hypothetical protein